MARWLIPLGCALGCPLMMGVMAWGLGRDREAKRIEREVRTINKRAGHEPVTDRSRRSVGLATVRRLWCSACLNWKVVVPLVGVAAVLAVVSPQLLAAAGPGLLLLVCPLSMVVAMVAMSRRRPSTASQPADPTTVAADGAESSHPDPELPEPAPRHTVSVTSVSSKD